MVSKDYVKPPVIEAEPPLRISHQELEDLQTLMSQPLNAGAPTKIQDLLKMAEKKLPPATFRSLSDWFFAQLSEDPVVNFEDHYLGRQKQEFPGGPTRYSRNGERPFDGYLAARKALQGMLLHQVDLEKIQDVHRKLMSRESIRESSGKIFQIDGQPARNSQALKDSELGVIRSEGVGFEVDGKHLPQGFSATGRTVLSLKDTNKYLRNNSHGYVNYAPLSQWRSIDNKKPLSDGLVLKLRQLEEKYGVKALDRKDVPEIQEGYRLFLKELANRVWEEAKESVTNATERSEVIGAVADFQRDFISIHPFLDGNGRLARLLTEKLLESRALPPPIYTYWGEDVGLPREEMEKVLSLGVLRSQQYQAALMKALSKGEPFESVVNPALFARVQELLGDPTGSIDSKGFLKWIQDHREEHTKFSEAVREFSKSPEFKEKSRASLNPEDLSLSKELLGSDYRHFHAEEFVLWRQEQTAPDSNIVQDIKRYVAWLEKHTYGDHSGAIRLASPQFQRTFGRLSSNQTEFETKLKNYYADEPVYRGVPSNKYLTDVELIRLFAEPSNFNIGNGVSVKDAPESALPVFQQFNLGLLRNGDFLSQQIVDHKNGLTDDYNSTGMVSFSENRGVAVHWHQNFADPAGIIFTAKKRVVGVVNTAKPTERFKQKGLANEFEEAMLGGTDPESLTSIEVVEHFPLPDKTTRRVKRATRLSFNKIQITEAELDDRDRPRITHSTLWEVEPNGRFRQLPQE